MLFMSFMVAKRNKQKGDKMETKRMAFAGSWYPRDRSECENAIQGFLNEKSALEKGRYAGGIVPHAGWFYSGSIACRVIKSLQSEDVDTIVLFGGHMHQQSEPFILSSGRVETPFGDIDVDEQLVERILDGISIRPRGPGKFPDENTLELQYPFIKYFFPNARIVVCGVAPSFFASIIGNMVVEEAGVLSRTIKIIGSTDMTHYGPDFGLTSAGSGERAVDWVKKENDRMAVEAMLDMDESRIIAQGLENKNMCCPGAAAATAAACKKMGAVNALELDYATSFEKSQSASFVGYSGVVYAFS